MAKSKKKAEQKNNLLNILAIISTLSLLFISINLFFINKKFVSFNNKLNELTTQLSEIKSDTNSVDSNVRILKKETGWEGLTNSKNDKKSDLLSCINDIKTFSASSGSDYTTYMLICIANYLAK